MKGVSSPKLFDIAIAIAVLPVPGWPPRRMALPAIFPSLIIYKMMPAALLASDCPTMPMALALGSSYSLMPKPLMCECAPTLSILVTSLTSAILGVGVCILN